MKKSFLFLMLTMLATTLSYGAVSYTLHEGFEGDGLPTGWTQEYISLPIRPNVDTVDFSWGVERNLPSDTLRYPFGAVAGEGRAFARNASPDEMRFKTRLITPVFSLTGVFQPQLLFSHAEVAVAGMSDTLRVYYRSQPGDVWRPLNDAKYYRTPNWKTEVLGLPAASSTYQLAFEITENMGRGVVLDEVIVRSTPTCLGVENILARPVHAYDALITWDAPGSYNEFQLILADTVLTNPATATGSHVLGTYSGIWNPELQLENLTPQTTYYVYVRSDCNELESGWTEFVESSFRTLTVAYLPYTENFNNAVALAGNAAFGLPEGWLMYNNVDDNLVLPFTPRGAASAARQLYSIDSTAYLAFNAQMATSCDPIPANKYALAVSPEFVTSSLQGLEVSFWATAASAVSHGVQQYAASLIVGVMTDPADIATFEAVDTVVIEAEYQHKRFDISLASYTGTGKYIALKSLFAQPNAIYVDNFSVRHLDVPTLPTVKVSEVSPVKLHVTADIAGADKWNILVASEYSRTGAVSPNNVIYTANNLTSAAVDVLVADSSLAGKTVCVYAQAVKFVNGRDEEGAWSFPVTVRVPESVHSYPAMFSFEASQGQFAVSTLNNEIRNSLGTMAPASVYFPLTSQESENNSFPRLVSQAPNFRGAHVQLCGIDTWFTMPEVDTISTLQVVFRYATLPQQVGELEVGVMTDPYDAATFVPVASFRTEKTKYQRCLVAFDGYQGNGHYIAFRSKNAGSGAAASVNLIDEVSIQKLGTCREASNFAVSAHAHEASITWNGSNMDGWILEYGTSPTLMNSLRIDLQQPAVTLTGLNPETTYYYAVTTICSGDTMWADDVHEFVTPRGLPFTESFTGALSEGWTRGAGLASDVFSGKAMTDPQSTTSSYVWTTTNSSTYRFQPQSGFVAYASSAYSAYAPSAGKWLVSPQMYLDSDADNIELTFDLAIHNDAATEFGPKDVFMVAVSVDGGNTWNEANATIWDNKGTGNQVLNNLNWEASQRVAVDFTEYLNRRIKFAFYLEAQSTQFTNYVSIDNVTLRVADPSCGGISNVTATALSETTAQVRFARGGNNPHPAIVDLALNPSFTTILQTDTLSSNLWSISDLEPSTHYYVRVRQNCQNDPDWQVVDFNTFCSSVTVEHFGTETFEGARAIDCWTTGFVYANGSGALPAVKSDNAYGNVLQIVKSSVEETASDGTFAVTPQFEIPDSMHHYQVVFDALTYNNDATNVHKLKVGVVTDPADVGFSMVEIATINLQYSNDSTGFKTYVVSLENYQGDIDGNYGRYIGFMSEAGADSTNYIYIDNVRIEPAQGCHQVIDLEADVLTAQGAHFIWSGGADSYEFLVTDELVNPAHYDFSHPLVYETTTDTTFVVDGLEATTTYFAYVRSHCGEEVSAWSSATRFTTSYGLPFSEFWTGSSFSNGVWTRYTGRFVGDSILGSALNAVGSSTSLYVFSEVNSYSSDVTGMAGYVARGNIYANYQSWFVSPNLDLSVDGDAEIRFTWKMAVTPYSSGAGASASTDKRIGVLVSTDDGATWRKSQGLWWTCTAGDGNNFKALNGNAQTYSMDMTDYQNQSVRIAFYGESTGSSSDLYFYFDSIQVRKYEAVCLGVRNFSATLTDDTTAVAHWTIFGTPAEVEVMLSEDPDFMNVISRDTTTLDSMVFSNLSYTRTYYIRATQIGCDEETAKTISISTPLVTPYSESFLNKTLPADWTLMKGSAANAFAGTLPTVQNSSSFGWKVNSTGNGLTGDHIYCQVVNSTAGNDKFWFVSPEMAVKAAPGENVEASFDIAVTAHNKATAATVTDNMQFRVLVTTDNGQTWLEENSYLFANNLGDSIMRLDAVPATGMHVSLDLSKFAGERIRVALYEESAAAASASCDVHIANFEVRVPASCDNPASLECDDVKASSAHITWTSDDTQATIVEYSTNSNFAGAVRDTVAAGLNAHTVMGLVPGMVYNVRVATLCGDVLTGYSNVVTFTTALGLPFNEPMESRPTTWSHYSTTSVADGLAGGVQTPITGTTSGWRLSTSANVLGGNHLYAARSTKAFWFVTPDIDLVDNEGEDIGFSFDLALTKSATSATAPATGSNYSAHSFRVLVSTDGGENWTKEWLWSQADSANFSYLGIPATGQTINLDFSEFGGQSIRIAFVMGEASTGTAYVNINNVVLESLTTRCFGVRGFTVNKLDTAAYLTINPADDAHQWQVVCGTDTQTIDTTFFALHNLQLDATYQVIARSICSEGDTSVWSAPFTFTMPHGLEYVAELRGEFNEWTRYQGAFNTTGTTYTDSLKIVPSSTTSGAWAISTSSVQLGASHVYCAASNTATNWLVSPAINLQRNKSRNKVYLSFDMALTSSATSANAPSASAASHTFRVAISEDGGRTWQFNQSYLWADNSPVAVGNFTSIPAGMGKSYHIDLSAYKGKEIRVAFIREAIVTGFSAIHINDVDINEYSTLCFSVGGLKATLEDGVAKCVITPDDASKANAYQYEIVKSGMAPTGAKAVLVNDTVFTTPVLPKSSVLDIYVRALCGTNDTSAWFGPVTITTPIGIRYENALTSIAGATEYTSSDDVHFTASATNFWSAKTMTTWGTNSAYINAYTTRHSMLALPEIDFDVDGGAVEMSFEMALRRYASTTAPTTTAGQSFEVRASVDGGATWSAPLATWSDEKAATYTFSGIPVDGGTYTVDLSDYLGELVRVGFYSISTGQGADNDIYVRNVVIDTIPAGAACGTVRSISLLDSTYTTATVKLRGAGIRNAAAIEYMVLEENSIFRISQSDIQVADTNIITINNLENSMGYDLYARVMCADSTWTEWSGPFTFHTVECSGVQGINVSECTLNDVKMTLVSENAKAAVGYYYYITEHDGILDPSLAIYSRTAEIEYEAAFNASTLYDVYARKICQVGDTSDWAGPFVFHSPYGVRFEETFEWADWNDEWKRYSGELTDLTETTSSWTYGKAGYGMNEVHAYFNIYSTRKYLMVSPRIDLSQINPSSPIIMNLDVALTRYNSADAPTNTDNQALYILVSEDGENWDMSSGFSFQAQGGDYRYADIPNEAATYEFDMSQYAGQSVYIGIYGYQSASGADNDIHVANLVIDTVRASDCGKIASVEVSNVTLHAATVTISYDDVDATAAALCKAYYELSTVSDFSLVLDADTIHGTSAQILNLDPSTIYYIRVARVCEDDDMGRWSRVVQFNTALGVRYIEDFEEMSSLSGSGWTLGEGLMNDVFNGTPVTNTATGWATTGAAKGMTSRHIRINVWSTSVKYWAISPTIDLSVNVGQSLLFGFDAALTAYSSSSDDAADAPDDQFAVLVSTDEGASWLPANATIWGATADATKEHHYMDLTFAPQRFYIDFSQYAGQQIKIAFYGESTQSNGDNYLQIDNLDLSQCNGYYYTDSICQGSEYANYGFTFAEEELTPGLHTLSRLSAANDSLVHLNLFVKSSVSVELYDTICQGEQYQNYGFNILANNSDTYRRMLPSANGCDSLVLLHLKVNPIQKVKVDHYACKGETYHLTLHDGSVKEFYINGYCYDTLTSVVTGCDSIVQHTVLFSSKSEDEVWLRYGVCEGDFYEIDGQYYSAPYSADLQLTSMYGCDSIVHIRLLPVIAGEMHDTVLVDELPYYYGENGGTILVNKGNYKDSDLPKDFPKQVVTACGPAKLTIHVVKEREVPVEGIWNIFGRDKNIRKVVYKGTLYFVIENRWFDAQGRSIRQPDDVVFDNDIKSELH